MSVVVSITEVQPLDDRTKWRQRIALWHSASFLVGYRAALFSAPYSRVADTREIVVGDEDRYLALQGEDEAIGRLRRDSTRPERRAQREDRAQDRIVPWSEGDVE
jgi:hypothetical protein